MFIQGPVGDIEAEFVKGIGAQLRTRAGFGPASRRTANSPWSGGWTLAGSRLSSMFDHSSDAHRGGADREAADQVLSRVRIVDFLVVLWWRSRLSEEVGGWARHRFGQQVAYGFGVQREVLVSGLDHGGIQDRAGRARVPAVLAVHTRGGRQDDLVAGSHSASEMRSVVTPSLATRCTGSQPRCVSASRISVTGTSTVSIR